MKIYVGDELLHFTDDDLDRMYINAGMEAIVYRYGNEALKIYRADLLKQRLDEKSAVDLSVIDTKRILLPKKIIRRFNNYEFCGYSLNFIDVDSNEGIQETIVEEFLDELDLINDDLKVLADNYVEINDFSVSNLLYNGKFFMGDPGSFSFKRNLSSGVIYENNIFKLNQFVIKDIFGMVDISYLRKCNLKDKFLESEYIGNMIRETADSRETINQYVKRLTR